MLNLPMICRVDVFTLEKMTLIKQLKLRQKHDSLVKDMYLTFRELIFPRICRLDGT